ncbi:uncharacterized protein [Antedon mediterranea]|uniref:uncharacterized protein n=1 Tax=Antedon mediterranea TaxID=105859 RepID=UPI003AF7C02C
MQYYIIVLAETLILFFCQVQMSASIKGWHQEQYPNIFTDPYQCGRPYGVNDTWICDPDGILTSNQDIMIDETLKDIQNSSCLCDSGCGDDDVGLRIVVALVGWMTIDIDFIPKKEQAYMFAKYLLIDWFHRDTCDNNVVIFYAYEHNQLAFAFGSDVWPLVTELEYARLVDSGRSRLGGNKNNTYMALDYIITTLHKSIENGPGLSLQIVYSITVIGALVVLLIFMCLVSNTCCRVQIPKKMDDGKLKDPRCGNKPTNTGRKYSNQ